MLMPRVIRVLVQLGRLCMVLALLLAGVCDELVSWAEALERRNQVLAQLRYAPKSTQDRAGGRL